jgi:hypothetical protein
LVPPPKFAKYWSRDATPSSSTNAVMWSTLTMNLMHP